MKKAAIIFPGQGSQYIGMGQEFVDQEPAAAALMDLAENISGFPIRTLCFAGPIEDLTRVLYLQPALTAINLICWQQLRALLPDFQPAFFAGHSLGEYSALHGAGVLTLEDTLALVTKRGELMEREGAMHPGGMRAVVGETLIDFPAPDHATWDEAMAATERLSSSRLDLMARSLSVSGFTCSTVNASAGMNHGLPWSVSSRY